MRMSLEVLAEIRACCLAVSCVAISNVRAEAGDLADVISRCSTRCGRLSGVVDVCRGLALVLPSLMPMGPSVVGD